MTGSDAAREGPLRMLLVEDSDDDAALIVRAVRNAGYAVAVERVQTERAFREALTRPSWDLVISDHSLPQFSSTAALRWLQSQQIDCPFIVVSGTIDEESAVAILRAGAHDFVTKQNLARLGPAIRRELEEAQNRAARRQAQRELQLQRDFLRLVIDTNPNLIYVKDSAGRFVDANRALAELYGISIGDLLGKTDAEIRQDPDERERGMAADREVLATGAARFSAAECITDLRTRQQRWFEMRRVPMVLPDGTLQVLGIGTEITERLSAEKALRVTEEQFRQAQKMEAVGQLAGGIAHDFNNLLTAILGYSELLLDRVRDDPDLAADVEEIRKSGQRASSLTAQLLAFSRKQVLEPRILDLNEIVSDANKMLRRVIGEDIQVETSLDPSLRRVKADPGQMQQVLMNLVINARDAMPRGGTLRISTRNVDAPADSAGAADASAWVALAVADTGPGIPPEIRERIFEPFFTTKGPGKGTGLGLSMVYGVVAQSGGRITVDSARERGTTFTIYLPAVAEGEETVPQPLPSSREELRGTETILLVEDERGIRELVRKVLVSYGYEVLEASDPDDAVRIAERHPAPIHLMVSDIVMPHMSGPELAQRIVPRRREMRVLYMSGFTNRLGTSLGSLSAGVALVHKPFTPERLARTVKECLRN